MFRGQMKEILIALALVLGGCAVNVESDERVIVDSDSVMPEQGSSDYDRPLMSDSCRDTGTVTIELDGNEYRITVPDAFCGSNYIDKGDPDPTQPQLPDVGEQLPQEVVEF